MHLKMSSMIKVKGKWATISGDLRLCGNHTMTEYKMSGEPYSQKSGWITHSIERIFKNKYSLSSITCNGQYCSVLSAL